MAIGSQDQSHIHVSEGGTSFVGKDGVLLYKAIALKVALRAYANTGMRMNRTWTPTAMMREAAAITKKTYHRRAYGQAADDLAVWINAMKAALPVTRD
jgi:hypothetical protein